MIVITTTMAFFLVPMTPRYSKHTPESGLSHADDGPLPNPDTGSLEQRTHFPSIWYIVRDAAACVRARVRARACVCVCGRVCERVC